MRLPLLFSVWLVFVLSLTSVTAAVMRGQMAGATEMVVCGSAAAGTATVVVDATGRPVAAPHHCPVCIAGAGLAAGPVPDAVARPVTRGEGLRIAATEPVVTGSCPQGQARGPPRAA